MNYEVENLLHPRIIRHCNQMFDDCHYDCASLEAMKQVELALKEKSGIKNRYGVNLCTALFGNGKGIKLRVPFGDDMQLHAERLLAASFSYYRNYAAHDGSKIDNRICIRIMILASELLDLIGASSLSFDDIGGVNGLVQAGYFNDAKSVSRLLSFLDSYTFPDIVVDRLYEELSEMGFSSVNVKAVIELGLVEYFERAYIPSSEKLKLEDWPPDTLGWFELTPLGKEIISNTA